MNRISTLLLGVCVALPVMADYEINFPADAQISGARPSRIITGVGIGENIVDVPQATDKLLYHDFSTSAIFDVTAGTAITPVITWNGTYMHGYFYADLNNDGKFDYPSELYSFSYFQGVNSLGLTVKDDCNVTLHPFVLSASQPAGDYRVRFIIDWDSSEPGGRFGETNTIIQNDGAIVDATLRVAPAVQPENKYAVNYTPETTITHNQRRLHNINVTQPLLGMQSIKVGQSEDKLLYHDCTDQEVDVLPGGQIQFNFDWTGTWMNSYVYIDRDGNGDFLSDIAAAGVPVPGTDIMAYSHVNNKNSLGQTNKGEYLNEIPAFALPSDLIPGKYRCRAKIDWDNADAAGSDNILENGGSITDFTLNVLGDDIETTTITLMPLNCMITLSSGAPVPETLAAGYSIELKVEASLPGFTADHLIVRHGQGESRQDTEVAISADGLATIPAEIISGDVIIYGLFEEQADSEWTKIWGDEFNTDNLNKTTWGYQPRYNATWNRYCAVGDAEGETVNTFGNGYYNSWCVPTDKEEFPSESEAMISGAINTQGKFHFHYGRIEARIKTHPFKGNFPAFWLMPETNAEGGWPRSGEIDIWEQIDAQDKAHATVHTGWTGWKNYCGWTEGPKVGSPTSSGSVTVDDMAAWHYYALEWTEDMLTWYVDGKVSFTYKNMHYSEEGTNYTAEICWPFYKDFYVILNQSVGNGAWAQWADLTHTYLTQFDYVRCYQKKGENLYTTPLTGNGDDPDFFTPLHKDSIQQIESNNCAAATYYDLQGRPVANPTTKGIYIKLQGNKATKIVR
ncbi:MAG: glycoside hydrolase family 16 protein [Bacteroides sp.]|nr:glycoside hydrolase family 16 protein [Bacteroides sp.]MCM1379921.1 glycoside hydrolase family 16 protein [Bacteroides sp.]MCM1446224.1 glycoside hydrolase family 16 protein [Prevotella sp.]